MDTGTLVELGVVNGDTVECVDARSVGSYYHDEGLYIVGDRDEANALICPDEDDAIFRVVSRISDDNPKAFGDLSDEEKGGLLLAHHEGKVIECKIGGSTWIVRRTASWVPYLPYRIKPEHKVETVELRVDNEGFVGGNISLVEKGIHTHLITFTTTDGEPDLKSIKMEKV